MFPLNEDDPDYTLVSETTDSRAGDFDEYDSSVFRRPDDRSLSSLQKALIEAERRRFGAESITVASVSTTSTE